MQVTIDIICDYVEGDPSLSKFLPRDILRRLLLLCTTESCFLFDQKYFRQVDGVSMGSPLGPLFANFYLGHMESQLFGGILQSCFPSFYVRYVDDIFCVFDEKDWVMEFVNILNRYGVIKFTVEWNVDNKLAFLDAWVALVNGKVSTSVFHKDTFSGAYLKFSSPSPDKYKWSVLKTLLVRAWRVCSPENLGKEVSNIRQNLINNGYPQTYIDRVILWFYQKNLVFGPPKEQIKLFCELPFISNGVFTDISNKVRGLVFRYLTPVNHAIEIKCSTFASSSKLQSLFKKSPNFDPSRVVYWWKCSFPSCNAGYVGQTTDFKTRVIAHRNVKTSAIAEHLNLVHDINNSIQQGRPTRSSSSKQFCFVNILYILLLQ